MSGVWSPARGVLNLPVVSAELILTRANADRSQYRAAIGRERRSRLGRRGASADEESEWRFAYIVASTVPWRFATAVVSRNQGRRNQVSCMIRCQGPAQAALIQTIEPAMDQRWSRWRGRAAIDRSVTIRPRIGGSRMA